jgi:NDP-sugar pyrophosphorylase family protein
VVAARIDSGDGEVREFMNAMIIRHRAAVIPEEFVADGAVLTDGVVVAPGAVIHDDVRVGRGGEDRLNRRRAARHGRRRRLSDRGGALVGNHPRLRPGSSAAGKAFGPLVLASGASVCAGAVVYAGARIAEGAIIGDQSQVRELVEIGPGSVIGRGPTIDQGARIGSRVLIQTSVYLCGGTIVEDDVFIGPGVITTNDNTMDRLSLDQPLLPPVFRRACRVGGGATLFPASPSGRTRTWRPAPSSPRTSATGGSNGRAGAGRWERVGSRAASAPTLTRHRRSDALTGRGLLDEVGPPKAGGPTCQLTLLRELR